MNKKQIVYNYIKNKIDSSVWGYNTVCPSENRLCKDLNVSRITVRNAIRDLKEDGYLYSHQGMGTFVKKDSASCSKKYIVLLVNRNNKSKIHSVINYISEKVINEIESKGYKALVFDNYHKPEFEKQCDMYINDIVGCISVLVPYNIKNYFLNHKKPLVSLLTNHFDSTPCVMIDYTSFFTKFLAYIKQKKYKKILIFSLKQNILYKYAQKIILYGIESYLSRYDLHTFPESQTHTLRADVFIKTMKKLDYIPDAVLFFDETLYSVSKPYFSSYDSVLKKTHILTHSSGALEIDSEYKTTLLEFNMDRLVKEGINLLFRLINKEFIKEWNINIEPDVIEVKSE